MTGIRALILSAACALCLPGSALASTFVYGAFNNGGFHWQGDSSTGQNHTWGTVTNACNNGNMGLDFWDHFQPWPGMSPPPEWTATPDGSSVTVDATSDQYRQNSSEIGILNPCNNVYEDWELQLQFTATGTPTVSTSGTKVHISRTATASGSWCWIDWSDGHRTCTFLSSVGTSGTRIETVLP